VILHVIRWSPQKPPQSDSRPIWVSQCSWVPAGSCPRVGAPSPDSHFERRAGFQIFDFFREISLRFWFGSGGINEESQTSRVRLSNLSALDRHSNATTGVLNNAKSRQKFEDETSLGRGHYDFECFTKGRDAFGKQRQRDIGWSDSDKFCAKYGD
jgi:hypothetical protein